MKKIMTAFALLLGCLFVAAPAQLANAADDPIPPAACDWTISNYGTNNGFYLINNATHRVRLDYTMQVRRDGNGACPDQWRGKMTAYCYEGLAPRACTLDGVITLYYNSDGWAAQAYNDDYASSGAMTWYVGWYNFPGVGGIQTKTFFEDAEVGTTYYNVADGTYGGSKYCARSGPAVGGTVSC